MALMKETTLKVQFNTSSTATTKLSINDGNKQAVVKECRVWVKTRKTIKRDIFFLWNSWNWIVMMVILGCKKGNEWKK